MGCIDRTQGDVTMQKKISEYFEIQYKPLKPFGCGWITFCIETSIIEAKNYIKRVLKHTPYYRTTKIRILRVEKFKIYEVN